MLSVHTVPPTNHPSSDSVHNDGERHIPYITIFPNSTINKLYAWAKFQLSNGMIQEQLRCGCQSLPLQPKVSCYLRIYRVTATTYQHIMIDYNADSHNMVSKHPINYFFPTLLTLTCPQLTACPIHQYVTAHQVQ